VSELLFPIVGGLMIFAIAVPGLSAVTHAIWVALPEAPSSIDHHGRSWGLAVIVGPVLVPVLWMLSAAVHQVEAGAPLTACIIDHLGGELCRDIVLFGLVLATVVGIGIGRRMVSAYPALRTPPLTTSGALIERVAAVCRAHRSLRAHEYRIRVVDAGRGPVCTRGLLRPLIEIEADVAARLSDEELEAVLLHELAHALSRDPLRQFVAQVALTLNPLGARLEADFARYCFAREALCDRRAVEMGADPLSLARSIVTIAGPRPCALTTGLGGMSMAGVRVRVQLLLNYASEAPREPARMAPFGLFSVLLVAIVAQPHLLGTAPLDLLHIGIERAALLLGLH
jgi:hypothetical protein